MCSQCECWQHDPRDRPAFTAVCGRVAEAWVEIAEEYEADKKVLGSESDRRVPAAKLENSHREHEAEG